MAWEPWLHALPVEFDSEQRVFDEFGRRRRAGTFSRRSTRRRPDGGCTDTRNGGSRSPRSGAPGDYWTQWRAVRAPTLLIEAGNSVTPPGQMRRNARGRRTATYLHVPGAGHLVHDDAPQEYRDAVEPFLSTFARHA